MEEIKKEENLQTNKEEIKLITFQPQYLIDEINKLKEEIYSYKLEINTLNMMITDLIQENNTLLKKTFKSKMQDILLSIFGGQWEEGKK